LLCSWPQKVSDLKIKKEDADTGVQATPHRLSLGYSSLHPLHTAIALKGARGVKLLLTASIAGLVQSSNSGSCQPLLFCGLSQPPRFATPFTNHAPLMQNPTLIYPTPYHCWKKIYWGSNDICREEGRGLYRLGEGRMRHHYWLDQ